MLLNLYCYMIFIPMILISSLMILISNSWLSQWMIMEINLISFLSMIVFEKKNNSISMNYFLIQSFNSYLFIMMIMNLNFLNLFMSMIILFIINLCLLMKMGLPPFYLWYIKIMKFLNWMNCLFLMTIQKFIPLMILNNLMLNNLNFIKFNMINLIYMSFISALFGLQSMNLKILMSYSSIIQNSWMIMLINLSETMFLSYMLIYFMISLTLILIFNKFNLIYLSDLVLLKFGKSWIYMMYMFTLMSMSGMPPFFGFMMKWISIQIMNMNYSFYMIFFMVINSLVSMFFYLRLTYISYMNYVYSLKFNYLMMINMNNNKNLIYMIWMMLILLMFYEII